ncbi:MAG: hypothetical protein COX19_00515 [Desulfobacterales bacterium CG23_combo_of_CG06-09_8_20_14_all_51_8]|nr:MAG: hypothetical protein COX19_00515 [Desulfobacterales bacterium CG23_combo_of_CG06-09_8_20_14_all_51_8]
MGNKISALGADKELLSKHRVNGMDGIVSNWNPKDGRINADRISGLRADGKVGRCQKHRFQIETENGKISLKV